MNQAILRMDSDEELAGRYPYAFHARMTITLTDEGLISAVEVTRILTPQRVMPCDLGMHPFFLIEDYDALTLVAHPERMEDTATGIPLDHLKKEASVFLAQGCFLSHCPMIAVEDPLRNQRMDSAIGKRISESDGVVRRRASFPGAGTADGTVGWHQSETGRTESGAPGKRRASTWSLRLSRLKPETAADCPEGTK